MKNSDIFLSVIIPCYNEETNLRHGVLSEVIRYLERQPYTSEIVVVDDGSTDGSLRFLNEVASQNPNITVLPTNHSGKPVAIWKGIKQAKGDIVLFTDMDQSTPIFELKKILPWHDLGFEAVIGSRGVQRKGFSILRRIGSFVFRTLRRLLLLRHISDTQCGFKSCKRATALEVFPRLVSISQQRKPQGWKVTAFDVEFLYILDQWGYMIKEVNVDWADRDVSTTKSRKSPIGQYLHESIEMLAEVISIRIRKLRNMYSKKDI